MAADLITDAPPRVQFTLPRLEGIRGVTLMQELRRPRLGPKLRVRDGVWQTELDVSGVDRLEYLFSVTDEAGDREMVPDPDNPARVDGPFGEKSEFRLPEYRPPLWLEHPGEGRVRPVELGQDEQPRVVGVWSPPRIRRTTAMPLLLVHDGTEYARYSQLLQFCWWAISHGGVGAFRVALLDPGERDREYSADPRYTDHVAESIIPALTEHFRTTSLLGMGASLGALAMMYVHVHGVELDGLFLQSGAFFRPNLDDIERRFSGYGEITGFVGNLLDGTVDLMAVPTAMTCGTVEENLANNRLLSSYLTRQGWDVDLTENRDTHNWVAWRDSLQTGLLPLLRQVWG